MIKNRVTMRFCECGRPLFQNRDVCTDNNCAIERHAEQYEAKLTERRRWKYIDETRHLNKVTREIEAAAKLRNQKEDAAESRSREERNKLEACRVVKLAESLYAQVRVEKKIRLRKVVSYFREFLFRPQKF